MKKTALLLSISFLLVISMQNCKPDEPIDIPPIDSDTLYIGTPYTLIKPNRFPTINNSYKDSLTYEGVELGRRLFYDVNLSSTGQLACASCHKQEFAFSDAGNAKSINVFGPSTRNSPPVENLLWANKLFWDGRVNTLGEQAKDAYHGEQDFNIPNGITYLQSDSTYTRLFRKAFGRPGNVTEEKIYLAVQQFMMTLISSESKFDKVQKGEAQFTPSEQSGFIIFSTERGDCFHCHSDGASLLTTDNSFRNNGLDTAATVNDFIDKGRGEITGVTSDFGKFKSSSMRNIALTAPYMHDGRFNTLEEVIDFYSEGLKLSPTVDNIMLKSNHTNGGLNLTAQEKIDLINFLHTLTDTTFTNNQAFSNPF